MSTLGEQIEDLINRARLYRSCVTCEHFDEVAEVCTFNGANARPPAKVIAMGCDCYLEVPPF